MRKAIKDLIEFIQYLDSNIVCVSDLGLKFEGMSLDYVVLYENPVIEKSTISFVSGEPEYKHSVWLSSNNVSKDNQQWFDELCEQIVKLG